MNYWYLTDGQTVFLGAIATAEGLPTPAIQGATWQRATGPLCTLPKVAPYCVVMPDGRVIQWGARARVAQ